MSALPNYAEFHEEGGAFYRLGQLRAKLEEAEARARNTNAQAETANRLLEALAEALGVALDTLERISHAGSTYFKEVREQILKALELWDEDQKAPVCLYCGSPRVDWIEGDFPTDVPGEVRHECGWKCQDCGAIEDATGEGRAENELCSGITYTKRGGNL